MQWTDPEAIAGWYLDPVAIEMPAELRAWLEEKGIDPNAFKVHVAQGGASALTGTGNEAAAAISEAFSELVSSLKDDEVLVNAGKTDEQLKLEQLEEANQMLEAYVAAGVTRSTLAIEEKDGEYVVIFRDPQTNLVHFLNMDEVNTSDIGEGMQKNDLTGIYTTAPPPPPTPDQFPRTNYIISDPNYRIDVDPQDYFAMIRWLDPDVKERWEDTQALERLFPKDFLEQGISNTEYGLNERVGLTSGGRYYEALDGPDEIAVGPKYVSGDEVRLFWGKSPEYVASIQQLMIEGNLIDKNEVSEFGQWGMAEEAAMAPQLAAADRRGLSIRQWLEMRAENPLPEPQRPGFTTPVYQAPDMATLSQDLKSVFRARLGREPEPYEMGDLIRQMESDYYADYQQQVEGARMEWDARFAASETGEDQATGSIRNVDPFARFKEKFDTLYGAEVERNEAVQQNQADVSGMMSRLAGIERVVEGG